MYMIAVVAPLETHNLLTIRLTRHFTQLEGTGLAGPPRFKTFGEVLLAYDGSSSFADYVEDGSGAFSLTGGYRETLSSGEVFGSFCALRLCIDEDVPEIVTDSDALYPWPLYYGLHAGIAAVGNDVHAVAIALGLHELDERAVIELATRNWVIGRYTTVAGVSRIWPGERLRFPALTSELPDTLQPEKHYRRPEYDPRVDQPGFDVDGHIDKTFSSLVDSVSPLNIDNEDTIVQLSGGLDSRLTVLAIARAGIKDAHLITLNLEDGREIEIAEEISDRLGFKHEQLELPTGEDRDLRDAWLLTSGQGPVHAAASNLPVYRSQLQGRSKVRVVGAWPADLLVGDFVPTIHEFTDAKSLKPALKHWTSAILNPERAYALLGKNPLVKRHIRKLRKTIEAQIRSYLAPTAAQRISHWAFDRCAPTFAFVSPARLCANVLEVAPVMSPAAIKNLYELRGVDLPRRNFYQRMIWTKGPELRDIEYHNTGELLTPDYQPLPRMSQKLRLLLRLPASWYRTAESLLTRLRSRSADGDKVSVSFDHWDALFTPHIQQELVLSSRLSANPRSIRDTQTRVQLTATVLGCAWTREYLLSYVEAGGV